MYNFWSKMTYFSSFLLLFQNSVTTDPNFYITLILNVELWKLDTLKILKIATFWPETRGGGGGEQKIQSYIIIGKKKFHT